MLRNPGFRTSPKSPRLPSQVPLDEIERRVPLSGCTQSGRGSVRRLDKAFVTVDVWIWFASPRPQPGGGGLAQAVRRRLSRKPYLAGEALLPLAGAKRSRWPRIG